MTLLKEFMLGPFIVQRATPSCISILKFSDSM